MPCGPARDGVEHLLLIDAGAGQQMLHPVRSRVPGGLGHRPAVVIFDFGQQAVHHVTAGHAGLPPGEARRDPPHQVIEQVLVRIMVYGGISGCRVIVLFHKLAGSRQPRSLSRVFGHPLPACQAGVTLRLPNGRDLQQSNQDHDLQLP